LQGERKEKKRRIRKRVIEEAYDRCPYDILFYRLATETLAKSERRMSRRKER
jgi:hypothetical protein